MIVAEDVQCRNHSEPHNFILKALEVRVQKQPGLSLPKITYFSSWTFSTSTKTCTVQTEGESTRRYGTVNLSVTYKYCTNCTWTIPIFSKWCREKSDSNCDLHQKRNLKYQIIQCFNSVKHYGLKIASKFEKKCNFLKVRKKGEVKKKVKAIYGTFWNATILLVSENISTVRRQSCEKWLL